MKIDPAPKWSKEMRTLIINELATWKPYKEIWLRVTAAELRDSIGLEPLDPKIFNYDLFRMRCKRISKTIIAQAHDEWVKCYDGIRWAEEKARVEGLSNLIDKVTVAIDDGKFDKDTSGTMAQLVVSLRGLYEQIRKEVQADADREALSASGTRILLTNPRNVEIDAGYLTELLMVYRVEVGGLHKLDFTALNLTELGLLKQEVERVIHDKINAATQIEIIEENDEDDT